MTKFYKSKFNECVDFFWNYINLQRCQINQRIHDIAEARWKMLPIAVQREHDTLAMDIAELQWHLKQETAELRKAQNKVTLARFSFFQIFLS